MNSHFLTQSLAIVVASVVSPVLEQRRPFAFFADIAAAKNNMVSCCYICGFGLYHNVTDGRHHWRCLYIHCWLIQGTSILYIFHDFITDVSTDVILYEQMSFISRAEYIVPKNIPNSELDTFVPK